MQTNRDDPRSIVLIPTHPPLDLRGLRPRTLGHFATLDGAAIGAGLVAEFGPRLPASLSLVVASQGQIETRKTESAQAGPSRAGYSTGMLRRVPMFWVVLGSTSRSIAT